MRKISIGSQGFEDMREKNAFYVDKTSFIREWWENLAQVTLIARPRRFGKTLNLQMLECFFSNRYEGRGETLFGGLDIWKDEKYREIQGTYPVIFISFANVNEKKPSDCRQKLIFAMQSAFDRYKELWKDMSENEKMNLTFTHLNPGMSDGEISISVYQLSEFLYEHYGKKVIILLDEYDTPLQEAYLNGYWDDIIGLISSLFNSTLKTNPAMERAVMTGITRVSKESIFSQLNNPDVVTTTSRKYQTAFGFTEDEVNDSLKEYGLEQNKEEVKKWYDGFKFGDRNDIYNPWSITKYLDTGRFDTYWANTSSNKLISDLIWNGNGDLQSDMETLMYGGTIDTELDEEIVFSDLKNGTKAVWSLMIASGYLKIEQVRPAEEEYDPPVYTLRITNGEVRRMFVVLIRRWFDAAGSSNSEFVKSMINGDVKSMNAYINDIAETVISAYDTGKNPSSKEPERFYHGFVLGLLVTQTSSYLIRSNRESGYGRYDICLYPKKNNLPGIVIEFKVQDVGSEAELSDTADVALAQIQDRDYAADLRNNGVTDILEYGFAFSGKRILIKKA